MKRDPHTWKETHIHEKRPTHMKRVMQKWRRDRFTWKTMYPCKKSPVIWKIEFWNAPKFHFSQVMRLEGVEKTYKYEKRPTDVNTNVKRVAWMWKETHICTEPFTYQKRPANMKNIVFQIASVVCRNVQIWKWPYKSEKRPAKELNCGVSICAWLSSKLVSKETCKSGKKTLLIRKEPSQHVTSIYLRKEKFKSDKSSITCICTCTYMCIHMNMWIYNVCVYIYTYIYSCTYICIYTYMYIHIHTYNILHVYMYICTYIHAHRLFLERALPR